MVSKNYEWYVKTDLVEYVGKWVVIADEKVVASGRDAKEVYEKAKKEYPDKKLSIAKVPSGEMLILKNKTGYNFQIQKGGKQKRRYCTSSCFRC